MNNFEVAIEDGVQVSHYVLFYTPKPRSQARGFQYYEIGLFIGLSTACLQFTIGWLLETTTSVITIYVGLMMCSASWFKMIAELIVCLTIESARCGSRRFDHYTSSPDEDQRYSGRNVAIHI